MQKLIKVLSEIKKLLISLRTNDQNLIHIESINNNDINYFMTLK